jgi:hypothetical protein
MPQQQQTSSALHLAQRYAQRHYAPIWGRRLLTATVLLIAVLLFIVALPALIDSLHPASTLLLVFLLVFWLPMLLVRFNGNKKEQDDLYAQLLAILKDDTLPLSLTERVTILILLPKSTPPPMIGLAQARLAQKLAYASVSEVAALPRAPLHHWLTEIDTPEDLKISLLLALGTAQDSSILPTAKTLAQTAPTERLREAALECLKSLELAR